MTWNLVTGADGFVGQHLVAELVGRGEAVVGGVRRHPPELTTLSADHAEQVSWAGFDLEDRESVRHLVRAHRVDRVYHLAALSSVGRSLEDPARPFGVNALGTLFLLEEMARARDDTGHAPTTVISGSAEVYGLAANRYRPLTEDCPTEPLNPYAVSKAAQEVLALRYHRAEDLPIVVTRSFNHTGPGQRPPFVAPELALQVLAVCGGQRTDVRVGNLSVRRDFSDVRDVVRAYIMLADRGSPGGVYNVCSGRSYAVGELLEIVCRVAGVRPDVVADAERARLDRVMESVGDFSKLNEATGWSPEIGLERTLDDLLTSLSAG